MARVIEDLGHCGRASKPVGLRVYEPGSLPDPGQCAQALIAINDRSDGVPRARLAMSNGASWDIVAVTSDLQSQQTVDVQPHVHKAVAEATSQWAQRMAAAAPLTQTGMETEATLARHADEVAQLRQDLEATRTMLGEAMTRLDGLQAEVAAAKARHSRCL